MCDELILKFIGGFTKLNTIVRLPFWKRRKSTDVIQCHQDFSAPTFRIVDEDTAVDRESFCLDGVCLLREKGGDAIALLTVKRIRTEAYSNPSRPVVNDLVVHPYASSQDSAPFASCFAS